MISQFSGEKLRRVNILLVDDREDGLLALEAILKAEDRELIRARSGWEAVTRAAEYEFAVILLDIQMPELNGFETARQIQQCERNKNTPIIFVTAIHTEARYVREGYAAGAVDYLSKPYDPEILRSKVHVFAELFRKTQLVRELREKEYERRLDEARHEIEANHLRWEMKRQKLVNETLQVFRLVVDSIPEYAIFTVDPKGVILTWNPGAQRLLGYSEPEIIGRNYQVLYPPEVLDSDPVANEIRVALHEKRMESEGWRVRKDGTRFWGHGLLAPLYSDDESLRGFVKIMRDFTKRKKVEDRLRETAENLKQSNQELEQFAYVASHDLKEPLRSVTTYLALLEERYSARLDSEAREFIRFAVDGATRMYDLVDDLLRFSKIGAQGTTYEPVDCNAVLAQALLNLHVALEEGGASVTHDPLPTIQCDRAQMIQVFQNLVGNAVKFRGNAPPRIHIGIIPTSRIWHFWVRDNGIGIEPPYLTKIFVLFQRLHLQEEYPGTGIGLAICKKILLRHGGAIWAESEPGEGAVFHFTLPKTPNQNARTVNQYVGWQDTEQV